MAMPSSIRRLTALDHDRMHRLARRACAPGPSQERWRDELVRLVRAHLRAETGVLTVAVLAPLRTDPAAAREELVATCADLTRLADALGEVPVTSTEMPALVNSLQQVLGQHAEVLEQQVLLPLESAVARKEVRRLGGAYEQQRDTALHDEGEVDPPPRRLDLSRAELYELAKRAGIAGRSAMSRKDLIAELQRRQQTR